MIRRNKLILPVVCLLFLLGNSCVTGTSDQVTADDDGEKPKIVNIVNFIRQCEPRYDWVTEDVLFETVEEQVKMMKKYDLKGSFLLQYDALIDPRYQELLLDLPPDQFEIGAWWEIPQALVEHSGYTWRGRYPWDWHADVGFATGYTPEERVMLVDTYMARFKQIFGYYPKSAGSWFIDAHTLNYMHEKYGIIASCNCKDQIGTDGYTMWGGYWNQAYYPSRKNAYMPAQNPENQIPVPIFRMLGSDPIHQYDSGLGGDRQKVVSLEPVYELGGGDSAWCAWYFNEFMEGACMEYAYTQTGQENSFTWKRMGQGYKIQMPTIAALRDEGKLRVETLAESGAWFRENYPVTPPTSVTALKDHSEKDLKSVWFNSRYYRANLLWEKGTLRFRDIHLFDEDLSSAYLTRKGTSTQCFFHTLPFVDGFNWSSAAHVAGLRFKAVQKNTVLEIKGGDLLVDESVDGELTVTWPLHELEGEIIMVFNESSISLAASGKQLENWFLDLSCDPGKKLPFTQINNNSINCTYEGFDYSLALQSGTFLTQQEEGLRVIPEDGLILLDLAKND